MQQAADFAAKQKGAAIVYADCVRIGSHSNSDNHILYRDEKELADAKARDPLPAFRKWLIEEGMSEDDLAAIEEQARTEFNDAREFAETAPKPDPASAEQFIFAPAYEPQGSGTDNPAGEKLVKHPEDKKGRGLTLRQGINAALRREFRDNPDTFLWGQDIANKDKEGIFLVTKGMQAEFGDKRIFNGPIAENYILGTANGMSRFDKKIRIVVEGAEFADYFWPAMDQYLECSHEYYRTKGQFTPNVLIRLYIGGGLYHSQTIEGSLANIPGVRIVYPAFADDAYGLVRTAMKSQGPTLFLEPKNLYNDPRTRTQIPEEFEVPFGKARVRKEGTDVVVLTYGNALMMALKAAEELEQEAGGGKQEAGARSASDGETRDPEQIRMSQEAGPGPSAQSGIYAPVTGNPGGTGNPAGVSESNPPTPNSQSATPNTEHRTPNISVAVIDLRSLIPLDEETILDWVKKTGRVVIAHEGPEFGGFGGELAALISKKAFEYLDAPIQRVGARFSPIPFSPILEAQILPQPNWIKQAIVEVAKY
jgi:pyruvate/2-oxoglutarate/acetoin dehydrogenase E1 component